MQKKYNLTRQQMRVLFEFDESGNELKIISWKAAFKDLNKSGWKNVGKWTMITSIIPFILAILGIIFDFE